MRSFGGSLLHPFVKVGDRQRGGGSIAADLVEGQQPVIAVEGGILQRLGHHRAGELLNLERETAGTRDAVSRPARNDEVERQQAAQKVENAEVGPEPLSASLGERGLDDRAIFPARTRRRDVGAVDREMQDEQFECGAQTLARVVAGGVVPGRDARDETRQYGELTGQDVRDHPPLGLDQNLVEAAAITAQLAPRLLERAKTT